MVMPAATFRDGMPGVTAEAAAEIRETDGDLVARAQAGDTAAFGALVDRHRVAVFRAALAVLGDPAEAEDAVQDACLLAYRRLAGFRGEASVKTWLLAIAWRQALTRRRSRWWRWRHRHDGWALDAAPTDEGTGEALARTAAPGASAEEHVLKEERANAVAAAIRGLSPRYRDCLLLAASGEASYEEIARVVGVREGTVKWRVSEARRKVRDELRARGWTDV
jgi:RNA polymerase sigma-70 factor (ECF subfamily)